MPQPAVKSRVPFTVRDIAVQSEHACPVMPAEEQDVGEDRAKPVA